LYTAVRRYGCWPWQVRESKASKAKEPDFFQYAIAELFRLMIGGGLAWAAAANSQITGPFGAIAVGAAAPVIIGHLAKGIPLSSQQPKELGAPIQAKELEPPVQTDKLAAGED
jgi:hypothetical protein